MHILLNWIQVETQSLFYCSTLQSRDIFTNWSQDIIHIVFTYWSLDKIRTICTYWTLLFTQYFLLCQCIIHNKLIILLQFSMVGNHVIWMIGFTEFRAGVILYFDPPKKWPAGHNIMTRGPIYYYNILTPPIIFWPAPWKKNEKLDKYM